MGLDAMRMSIFALSFLLLTGCANSTPDPLRVYRSNDSALTCEQLDSEVTNLFLESGMKESDLKRTGNQNLTAFITGQLFLFPLLAMDVSGAGSIENRAVFLRIKRLGELGVRKGC